MSAAIRIKGLSKRYVLGVEHDRTLQDALRNVISGFGRRRRQLEAREYWALKDVDLTVEAGDVVAIIGRNGAGKSTLLKILSRVTRPTTGEVEVNGRLSALLEVGTGFHGDLTGRDNVFLNGALLGMTRSQILQRLDLIVEFSGVGAFLDTPVKRYSSGMYMRLAFAVAAHLEPDILVIDEVLAVGDADFQKKCVGMLRDLRQDGGRTILFVSHNLSIAKSLCSSAVVLEKGSIRFRGSVADAIEFYGRTGAQRARRHDVRGLLRRRGARMVTITEVEFDKDRYEPSSDFAVGIRLAAGGGVAVQGLFLAVYIVDVLGNVVYQLSTFFAGEPAPFSESATYWFSLPQLALRPGTYRLWPWVMANGVEQDFVEDEVTFDVDDGNIYGVPSHPHMLPLVQRTFSFRLEPRAPDASLGEAPATTAS